jgi:hypothetical protein
MIDVPPAVWAAIASAFAGGIVTAYGGALKRRHDREARIAELLARYRDPLLGAAFDLQSRLYNIVRGGFLEVYYAGVEPSDRAYACDSTLWLIGQYLGWTEILRRDVQFLDLGEVSVNRRLQERLFGVVRAFASSDPGFGSAFRLFRSEQRAIGELMIGAADASGRTSCLGYADFSARRRAAPLDAWFSRLETDLDDLANAPQGHPRIFHLQRALVDLVDLLDGDRVRYPSLDVRGKLPVPAAAPAEDDGSPFRVARFLFPAHEGDPWSVWGAWAREHGFARADGGDERECMERHVSPWRTVAVELARQGEWLEISAWTGPVGSQDRRRPVEPPRRPPTRARRRARRLVNDLLRRFDRPEV